MVKKTSENKVEIEIVVPWKDWKKDLDQTVKEISEELKIPGFRPGKAPKNIIEQKVGKEALLNQAVQKSIQKSYIDYVTQKKINVIGSPKVEIKKIAEGNDLVYKATSEVVPEAEVSRGYENKIKKINKEYKDKEIELGEEEVKKELDKLANSRVKLATVSREAKKGDQVEVDFQVLVGGVPIENGTSKNHPVVIGRGVFIPGFEEKLVGTKAQEEKEFELTFPEEYHKKELAGKKATFKVKVNNIQERQVPEVNDDFAKSLGKFENLGTLEKSIKEGMKKEKETRQKEEKRSKYIDEILSETKVEIPEALLKEELEKMMGEFEYQIQSMGMQVDDYLKKMGKTREEVEKGWREQAGKRVRSSLAMKRLVKDREIKVPSEEVEREMNKTLQYYKGVADFEKNIDMKRLYDYSRGLLENEKLLQDLEKI